MTVHVRHDRKSKRSIGALDSLSGHESDPVSSDFTKDILQKGVNLLSGHVVYLFVIKHQQ